MSTITTAAAAVLFNLTASIEAFCAARTLINVPADVPGRDDLYLRALDNARNALEKDAAFPTADKSIVSRNLAKALKAMVDAVEQRRAEGWRGAPSAAEEKDLSKRARRLVENVYRTRPDVEVV